MRWRPAVAATFLSTSLLAALFRPSLAQKGGDGIPGPLSDAFHTEALAVPIVNSARSAISLLHLLNLYLSQIGIAPPSAIYFVIGRDSRGVTRMRYAENYDPPPLSAELYLVRHGETEGNKKGVRQGNVDQEINQLNETGWQQARIAAEELYRLFEPALRNMPEQLVVLCSPLTRAMDTKNAFVTLVRDRLNVRLRSLTISEAAEINFGAWNNRTDHDIGRDFGSAELERVQQYMLNNPSVTGRGGQTFLDYCQTNARNVLHIINARFAGKTVILFAHTGTGNALRVVLGSPDLIDDEGYIDFRSAKNKIPNAKPLKIERYTPIQRKNHRIARSA